MNDIESRVMIVGAVETAFTETRFMPLILRAIITGFGYKLGAEIARYAATRIGLIDKKQAQQEEASEEVTEGLPVEPDDIGAEPKDEEEPSADSEP